MYSSFSVFSPEIISFPQGFGVLYSIFDTFSQLLKERLIIIGMNWGQHVQWSRSQVLSPLQRWLLQAVVHIHGRPNLLLHCPTYVKHHRINGKLFVNLFVLLMVSISPLSVIQTLLFLIQVKSECIQSVCISKKERDKL